jgi:hypothetical protein
LAGELVGYTLDEPPVMVLIPGAEAGVEQLAVRKVEGVFQLMEDGESLAVCRL